MSSQLLKCCNSLSQSVWYISSSPTTSENICIFKCLLLPSHHLYLITDILQLLLIVLYLPMQLIIVVHLSHLRYFPWWLSTLDLLSHPSSLVHVVDGYHSDVGWSVFKRWDKGWVIVCVCWCRSGILSDLIWCWCSLPYLVNLPLYPLLLQASFSNPASLSLLV